VLAQVAEELVLTLAELRELARGIHPAVLTSRGLSAALETLAARAPVPVELVATPGERLPEPIEATAYYVVAESLTNVAKYARATAATVSVARTNGRLLIEVRDDGVGGASIEAGSGLRGLADRVEAVRGTLRIESPPGKGTVIAAAIPITRAPELV
jgi:signal transduction histidine kinase